MDLGAVDPTGILFAVLGVADVLVLLYVLGYFLLNLGMLALALREVRLWLRRRGMGEAAGLGAFPPLVSLLVPAYNEEVTVVETVRSLLALDYPRYEIILINDGSSDRTMARLAATFGFEELAGGVSLLADGERVVPTERVRAIFAAPIPEASRAERLANDSDLDGDSLSVELVTPPVDGDLDLELGTYRPAPDVFGERSFTYGDTLLIVSLTPSADPTARIQDGRVAYTLNESVEEDVLGYEIWDGTTTVGARIVRRFGRT
jgi:hypothetical protein